ncbi:uncharacterized protein LOC116182857 [Photinus pyralis]|nr:uncharacterized protein LOC116182857 [Photinus pyralis]
MTSSANLQMRMGLQPAIDGAASALSADLQIVWGYNQLLMGLQERCLLTSKCVWGYNQLLMGLQERCLLTSKSYGITTSYWWGCKSAALVERIYVVVLNNSEQCYVEVMEHLTKYIEDAKKKVGEVVKTPSVKAEQEETKVHRQLFNQYSYSLNKSQSKFVSVGLSPDISLLPVVKLSGVKGQYIVFDEKEWKAFLEQQGVITNYFYSTYAIWHPIKILTKTIDFLTISDRRVIKISELGPYEIYLGWESILELWNKLDLIKFRLNCMSSEEFGNFYTNLITGVAGMPGEPKTNIMNVLDPLMAINCNNAGIMLEVVTLLPGKVELDVEVAKVFK